MDLPGMSSDGTDCPHLHDVDAPRYCSILIAGGPKRGKTTFCHNLAQLLARVDPKCKPIIVEGGSQGETMVTTVSFFMDADPRLPFQYTLLDTAAVECVEDVERIERFVKHSFHTHYEEEQSPVHKTAMQSSPDVRVDVCLYMLEPHQLPKEDIEAIKSIGKCTRIIPLIAKADSMTSSEVNVFSRFVESKLQEFCAPSTVMLSVDHAKESFGSATEGATHAVHRLKRVIASLESKTPGPFYPVRRLAWGTVEAWDPEVSDVLLLKRALQNESLSFLKKQSEEKYQGYRSSRMAEEKQRQGRNQLKSTIKACLVTFLTLIAINGFHRMALEQTPIACEVKSIVSHSLGVGTGKQSGYMEAVVPADTIMPFRQTIILCTSRDEQGNVNVPIFEGEGTMTKDNRKLADLRLEGITRGPAYSVFFEVTFDINASGLLTVTAVEKPRSGIKNTKAKSLAIQLSYSSVIHRKSACRLPDEVEELWVIHGNSRLSRTDCGNG